MPDRSDLTAWRIIVESHKRGYRVLDDGSLIGLRGSRLTLKNYGSQRYPTFSVATSLTPSGVFGVPVHLFAAYCFYGPDCMADGVLVRHLNGNTLDVSRSNIVLGTYSDNEYDKPESVRRTVARKARAKQPMQGVTAKLTETQVRRVREFYEQFGGRKPPNGAVSKFAAELGVNRNALAEIKSGKTWSFVD